MESWQPWGVEWSLEKKVQQTPEPTIPTVTEHPETHWPLARQPSPPPAQHSRLHSALMALALIGA